MLLLFVTVMGASLLGSLHCAGMCGAFVAFAVGTGDGQATARRKTQLQCAYHGGRLLTYTLLGAISGAIGGALDLGGDLIGVQRLAAGLAGAMMIGFGAIVFMKAQGVSLPRAPVPGFLERAIGRAHQFAAERTPIARASLIGLLTTLLPCGWLYAFVITAAGTASPALGAVVMAAFWVGTVPALALIGVGVQKLAGRFGARMPVATAIALMLVGLYTLVDRMTLPQIEPTPQVQEASMEEQVDRVRTLEAHDAACCADGSDDKH